MTDTKTANSEVFVGGNDWIVPLTRITNWTITPNNSTSNEVILNQFEEEMSIHATGHTYSFGTMYDNDDTDVLRSHAADDDSSDPFVCILDTTSGLESFEGSRANVMGLTESAPETDAITDSIEMPESGSHYYTVDADDIISLPNLTNADMDIGAVDLTDKLIIVICTAAHQSLTGITISDGTNTQDLAFTSVGVHTFRGDNNFDGSVAAFEIETRGATQTMSGYMIFANESGVPNG